VSSLICWIGVDSRAHSSIYLASDSRFSWSSRGRWDNGRKLFACRHSPDLLGYVGQVLFPSQVLSQVRDLIEEGLLFEFDADPVEKRDAIFSQVKACFHTYPFDRQQTFTIVHATRRSEKMDSIFYVHTLSWNREGEWQPHTLATPAESGIVGVWGTGMVAVDRWHDRWRSSRQGGRTSRSAFSAFCDALASGEDQLTGGPPQLVGLYRRGGGKCFGVVRGNSRYYLGADVTAHPVGADVEWYNALFERCDGGTMRPIEGAQRHPRARGLGKAL